MVSIYIKAFIISLAIFSLGILAGLSIERFRVSDFITKMSSMENYMQEIELEMLYFQEKNENHTCDFLNEIIRTTNNNLDLLAAELTKHSEKETIFSKSEIESLKKKYTFFLLKGWLLQERVKKDCGTKVVTVLYFYDREECDDCLIQGEILSVLKYSFKEKLMVYPLDAKVDTAMIRILINKYNITSFPSLVISEKVYSGIVQKNELRTIICDQLGNITQCI